MPAQVGPVNTANYGWAHFWGGKDKADRLRILTGGNRKARQQGILDNWCKVPGLGAALPALIAAQVTAIECNITEARVKLLLFCEVLQAANGYVSKSMVQGFAALRLSRSVFALANLGYLQRSGNYHKPMVLTGAGVQVCNTFRKHHRRLTNAIPIEGKKKRR